MNLVVYPVTVWAVLDHRGKFFQSARRWMFNDGWTDVPQRAKLFTKISQARARVSMFALARPDLPCPQLVEFTATHGYVLTSEAQRVTKVAERARTKEARRTKALRAADMKRAQASLDRASRELERLKKE